MAGKPTHGAPRLNQPFSTNGNDEKPTSKGEACPSTNVKCQLEDTPSLSNSELHHKKGTSITPSLVNIDPNKAVGNRARVEVLANAKGFYFFKFSNDGACSNVLVFGPWLFAGRILILKKWHPKLIITKETYSKIPVWVKLFNIPHEYWTEEGLSHIASAVDIDFAPKPKQEWRRVNRRDNLLVSSPQVNLEPLLALATLKGDEVIPTCSSEIEPPSCPTILPIHNKSNDLHMEILVDTSNKFSALDEDGDYCYDDDSPSTASPDQSLRHSKIKKNIDGVTIISLSNPTESSSNNNNKKKKHIAKKGKDNSSQAKVGWDPRILNITKISETDQIIHCNACILDTNNQFRIYFVYGSNEDRSGRALWKSMCSSLHGSPWIVLGDFNVSRRVDESIGACFRISGAMEEYNDCLQSSELDDLRFTGFLHTWCNKRSNSCISMKLDRVLVNNDWIVKFENSEAIFLPPIILDHCSSVVKLGLQAEEDLLRQKSRIQWLKAGDRNSSYFFKAINGKRNRSKIHSITGDDGSLIEDSCSLLLPPPKQDSGPEGFNAHFFKITWDIVGDDIISAIQEFFRFGLLLKEINATILALVPKVPNPSKMKDFKPISCCNTLYKIIAKIIANRIKPCLQDIIRPSQSAFMAGRSIGDNILLAQELMRNYHKDVGCPKLAIKVDLMKAFDMVDWGFLLETLAAFDFPPKFIMWIKVFLTTHKFSISFNGELTGFFSEKRGICQGDPMSPYLFVIAKGRWFFDRRIEIILPDIISSPQSAFVARKRIGDNILLVQELMRNYHKDDGSPKSSLKVCIKTPKFSISINGELAGLFHSKRGLRQGDHMSPYLFVIAMEVLTKLLAKHIQESPHYKYHWKYGKIKLSHLCFADDLIMFCHGSTPSTTILKMSLDDFSSLSGLKANPTKSNIFLSSVPNDSRQQLINILGYNVGSLPIRYLGIPIMSSKLGHLNCSLLLVKVSNKISSWMSRCLSYAGRLQLIISVLSSIQVFLASHLCLPSTVLRNIE
ncbi:hypothetical protein Dsin_024672 [Dipteronia sinensis]|uniref:Reverse transcriptase domain-containing protein n=1 Tax=Dipteronia sinensis TaxID=43782 RepID=A0AAD9ZUW9_9ROSI|nr:hypothetical protein Dsin_024672 [Dipteronia sinensis]